MKIILLLINLILLETAITKSLEGKGVREALKNIFNFDGNQKRAEMKLIKMMHGFLDNIQESLNDMNQEPRQRGRKQKRTTAIEPETKKKKGKQTKKFTEVEIAKTKFKEVKTLLSTLRDLLSAEQKAMSGKKTDKNGKLLKPKTRFKVDTRKEKHSESGSKDESSKKVTKGSVEDVSQSEESKTQKSENSVKSEKSDESDRSETSENS